MNGNSFSENLQRQDRSYVFLGEAALVSALDQTRAHLYTFAKHIHKTIEVYLITSGYCCMDIQDQKVICEKGDFVLISPNTVHSFYLETEDACTFRHIHFDPFLFSRWYLNHAEQYPMDLVTALIFSCNGHFHARADQRITELVSRIMGEAAHDLPLSGAYTNLYLAELMMYVIEQTDSQLSSLASHTPEQSRYVSYALTYIHQNFSGKILIQDIADHLNISARYLSKIFFQHMNLTILNYINIYRMNQAIDLMLNTDLSLTTISTQIGLKDSQHFSKLFGSIIGIPPNKYRKLISQGKIGDGVF